MDYIKTSTHVASADGYVYRIHESSEGCQVVISETKPFGFGGSIVDFPPRFGTLQQAMDYIYFWRVKFVGALISEEIAGHVGAQVQGKGVGIES